MLGWSKNQKNHFYIIKRQKIMRKPKNELDRTKIMVTRHIFVLKKYKRHFKNKISTTLKKILWQFVLVYLGLCTTGLLFESLKKKIWVGDKLSLSLQNSPFWIFEKKYFLQKLENKKVASNAIMVFEIVRNLEFSEQISENIGF
jgi:hypothetical protein